MLREVTAFTSGEGPGIFVRRGENFDEAPPAGGVKFKVASTGRRWKILGGPPFHKFPTWKVKCLKTPLNEEKCDFRQFLEKYVVENKLAPSDQAWKKSLAPPSPRVKKF